MWKRRSLVGWGFFEENGSVILALESKGSNFRLFRSRSASSVLFLIRSILLVSRPRRTWILWVTRPTSSSFELEDSSFWRYTSNGENPDSGMIPEN
jgi:hypothetical protein